MATTTRKLDRQRMVQDQQNERRIRERFTGGAYDLTTQDFQVWCNGSLLGFARSMADANQRAANYLADGVH